MNTNKLKEEYPILAILCKIFTAVGIIIVVISVIGLVYGLNLLQSYGDEKQQGIYILITSLVSAFMLSIPYFAFPALIKLLIKIEFNTRPNYILGKHTEYSKELQESVLNENLGTSFDHWKKENPSKTLHDYYASMKK